MLQLSYLTIHLGARKEIDNLLLILFYNFSNSCSLGACMVRINCGAA